MKVLNQIYGFLSSPFQKNLGFFLFLFILASSINFINQFYYVGFNSAVYWSLFGYVESYLFCLFIPLFNQSFSKIYKGVLLSLGLLNFIVDFIISMISSNGTFSDFVGIILGTNTNEIVEFFHHYISLTIILLCLVCLIILFVIYKVLLRIKDNKYIAAILFLILIGSVPLLKKDYFGHRYDVFIGKFYTFNREYNKNNHNLKDFYSNPKLMVEKNIPQNIIVIIGESFSRDFSSLYGYEKVTNPFLSNYSDSSLIKYTNVLSREIATIENIECIMSTYSPINTQKQWFESLTINEVLSKIGTKTYWISNQAEAGLYDNIPAKYAHLCDSTYFVSAKNTINSPATYDEDLILPFKNILENDSARKVVFLHLIGSHPYFQERYPSDRIKFKESDYENFDPAQRTLRAQYDNTIAYNDSVINEFFKIGQDKEALFFYFSDHGLDIYGSSPTYTGHARRGDKKSEEIAKRIPFMIYATPLYQQKFPEEMKRMYESVDNEFVTENFIYSLMDIMGVRFEENDDVKKYSLFRNSVSEN